MNEKKDIIVNKRMVAKYQLHTKWISLLKKYVIIIALAYEFIFCAVNPLIPMFHLLEINEFQLVFAMKM